jgi:hypothetical protein
MESEFKPGKVNLEKFYKTNQMAGGKESVLIQWQSIPFI